MIILLFGVSNVGKTSVGKTLADKLGYRFYDLDDEVQARYNTTLEAFVNTGTIEERDMKRGCIIRDLVENKVDKVIAVSPISYSKYFKRVLKTNKVLAIELRDSVENIFDRLVFSDENDRVYKDDDYKNAHKSHYLKEIYEDLKWYGSVYAMIENKYDMNNELPDKVADGIIKKFTLKYDPEYSKIIE